MTRTLVDDVNKTIQRVVCSSQQGCATALNGSPAGSYCRCGWRKEINFDSRCDAKWEDHTYGSSRYYAKTYGIRTFLRNTGTQHPLPAFHRVVCQKIRRELQYSTVPPAITGDAKRCICRYAHAQTSIVIDNNLFIFFCLRRLRETICKHIFFAYFDD